MVSEEQRPLHVVGIGASAGGLTALRTLFTAMPTDLGAAYVVVMHLSPEHESHLDDLLQYYTSMPVQRVDEIARLEPNHIYVIPPNANLDAIDTHLRLSPLEARRAERAPIDHFLRTLANAHQAEAIGIILTGAGSDGALGIRQIKEHGGLTIAQDPAEADTDSMPRAAIATGTVDLILRLCEIPDRIAVYCATRPRLPVPDGNDAIGAADDELLDEIIAQLKLHTDHDVSMYRRAAILQRIRRRMQLRNVDTLRGYFEVLRGLPGEPRALYDDIVMSVSEFFSDAALYERLEDEVIPGIFDGKTDSRERVRVWSIGCSTGEDAYSLAMLLLEEAARRARPPRIQVFATDLAEDLVMRARDGIYPMEVGATVAPERLEKFFVEELGHFRVRNEVRDIVVFATQNVFRDPPFAYIDLVVCRNLLANVQPAVRRTLLNIAYYALEPDGVLVLGPDDELDGSELFELEDEATHLYRRRPGPSPRQHFGVPIQEFRRRSETVSPSTTREEFGAIHERIAGNQFPASLLVDEHNQVVHYSPRAGAFIHIPGGVPTNDLLQLVAEPLKSQLRVALRTVRRDARGWTSAPLYVRTDGDERRVVLKVEPVSIARPEELALVVFEQLSPDVELPVAAAQPQIDAISTIAGLEADLAESQKRLREMIANRDDMLVAESFSADDLRSLNEELRSLLEELESSKEELQAANEELLALDSENRRRISELAELSGDLKHLLESTGIATLFLDLDLSIVRFTPQLGEIFNIRAADRGRPLSDLTHGLLYDELNTDALAVLASLEPHEREVECQDGRWFLARMLPYRSPRSEVEGVVLTLIDITDRKRADDKLRLADRRKDEFLALLAHELRNPLAPISSGVEILKMAPHDPNVVDKVATTIGRQTQQLVRLVDDLLEVSRISGGRLRLSREPLNLQEVVRDSIATARPSIDRARHELKVDIPDEPIVVDGDSARLTQALGNLLNNAVRYTPKGGRIGLTVAVDGDDAVIVVEDNGVGIPDDVRARVFEMFYQGSNSRAGRTTGLGIGLTLAKSLIEMHGGTIDVASEGNDRGARFTMRLPVAKGAELPLRASDDARPPVDGRRVLIVDDNKDAAETLYMLLRSLGDNDVRLAFSGADALLIADMQHPEIAFLDLKMPEMDGYEVARRIREQPWGADTTLVALTGFGQAEHKRRTKEAGFDRHLTKPAEREAVEAVLFDPPRAGREPRVSASS